MHERARALKDAIAADDQIADKVKELPAGLAPRHEEPNKQLHKLLVERGHFDTLKDARGACGTLGAGAC
jgi:hypothetical protein